MSKVKGTATVQLLGAEDEVITESTFGNIFTDLGLSTLQEGLPETIITSGQRHEDPYDTSITGLAGLFTNQFTGTWHNKFPGYLDGDLVTSSCRMFADTTETVIGLRELGLYSDVILASYLVTESLFGEIGYLDVPGSVRIIYEVGVSLPAVTELDLVVAGTQISCTQVVIGFNANGYRVAPSIKKSDTFLYTEPVPVPTPLSVPGTQGTPSLVNGSVKKGGVYELPVYEAVSDKSSYVYMIYIKGDLSVAWHFDPPVPVANLEGVALGYTNSFDNL